jgi:hypothetical protein
VASCACGAHDPCETATLVNTRCIAGATKAVNCADAIILGSGIPNWYSTPTPTGSASPSVDTPTPTPGDGDVDGKGNGANGADAAAKDDSVVFVIIGVSFLVALFIGAVVVAQQKNTRQDQADLTRARISMVAMGPNKYP